MRCWVRDGTIRFRLDALGSSILVFDSGLTWKYKKYDGYGDVSTNLIKKKEKNKKTGARRGSCWYVLLGTYRSTVEKGRQNII
jgi:hypothetical protein